MYIIRFIHVHNVVSHITRVVIKRVQVGASTTIYYLNYN